MCNQCGDSFAHQATLKGHMLTHTGERPHACPDCDKRFSLPQNLKKHMLVHTKEKRFVCAVCARQYGYACSLKSHMQTSHPHLYEINPALKNMMKEPENRFAGFDQAQSYLSDLFRQPAPVNSFEQCPHCGETVTNLDLHTEVCPWRQGPSWQ
jgi:uncharacterized Zn-finger protein